MLTQTHLTSILKMTYVLPLFASHPHQPTMRHLAGVSPNAATSLFTPTLFNPPSSNWTSHWHVQHHAVQMQSIGIYSQCTVAELTNVAVLGIAQTSQACLVVSMEHNAGTTNKIGMHQ